MKVKVYRNLHNGLYSIQQGGLVLGHAARVALKGASFTVSEAGRQRVIREGKKNVHAFAVGDLAEVYGFQGFRGRHVGKLEGLNESDLPPRFLERMKRVTYNPYKFDSFVDAETKQPMGDGLVVIMDNKSGVIAL